MQHTIRWLGALLSVLLPRARRRGRHALNPAAPPRLPDPYVWALPDPCEARWRRWARRGVYLPPPEPEDVWRLPSAVTELPPPPSWALPPGAMVRPYVLLQLGEDWRNTP